MSTNMASFFPTHTEYKTELVTEKRVLFGDMLKRVQVVLDESDDSYLQTLANELLVDESSAPDKHCATKMALADGPPVDEISAADTDETRHRL